MKSAYHNLHDRALQAARKQRGESSSGQLKEHRKLNTAGSRTPITDGFGPRWCKSAVISDLYLRRLSASGDGMLPPSVRRTTRR